MGILLAGLSGMIAGSTHVVSGPDHLAAVMPLAVEQRWKAAKLCSACKVGVSIDDANALVAACQKIHDIFWATKNRDVKWELAGG